MTNFEQIPPDAPIERALISCVFAEPLIALAQLRDFPNIRECFADGRHEIIFGALEDLVEAGEKWTPPFVESHLTASGKLFDGAPELIQHLFKEGVMTGPECAREYAAKLHATHIRRQRVEAAWTLFESERAGDNDASAVALKKLSSVPDFGALPPIVDAFEFAGQDIPEPSELVWGLLHQQTKMVLGGPSKAAKTFCLIDLALSVAHGEPFWSLKTTRAKVLFVNLEVAAPFFQRRIKRVAAEKRINIDAGQLHILNLRGKTKPYAEFLPQIAQAARKNGYGLLILDPLYKLLGGADENSARDINALLNAVELVVSETGAAIAFGAHFAKGNASGKESMDRISGSGVFARDPDTILTLTPHEAPDAFTVEAVLRNLKPIQPFVIRWSYPLMRRDGELDPTKLKKVTGRKAEHAVSEILGTLPTEGLCYADWRKASDNECGISKSTFLRLFNEAKAQGVITKTAEKWTKVQKVQNDN
jgi:hypothetical protein